MMTEKNKGMSTSTWILLLLAAIVVTATISFGIAYSTINDAKITAAKTSIGQIEAVFNMAQMAAEQENLKVPENGIIDNTIKSYHSGTGQPLSPYEQYIIDKMMDYFGENRDFDFAISRYQDVSGVNTIIYYFPMRGKTDAKVDKYYLLEKGAFSVHN